MAGDSQQFTLDESFTQYARKCCHERVESGGNTYIDFDNRTISKGQSSSGGYNFVDMSRGIVDWHTHPDECQSAEVCTVGVPSHFDFANVLLGTMFGTQAHILFSADGAYVISVDVDLLERMRKDKCAFKQVKHQIFSIIQSLHSTFSNSVSMPYHKYRDSLIEQMRLLGFVIHLFKIGEIPSVRLIYQPNLHRKGIQKIQVPRVEEIKICDEKNIECPAIP